MARLNPICSGAAALVLLTAGGCEGEREEPGVGVVDQEAAREEVQELQEEVEEQNAGEGVIDAPDTAEDDLDLVGEEDEASGSQPE